MRRTNDSWAFSSFNKPRKKAYVPEDQEGVPEVNGDRLPLIARPF